jgi:hypothetical protein
MKSEIPGHKLLLALPLKRFEYFHTQMFPGRLRIDSATARRRKRQKSSSVFLGRFEPGPSHGPHLNISEPAHHWHGRFLLRPYKSTP